MAKLKAVFLILMPLFCLGQEEHYNWFFGTGAGLDFSGGAPVAVAGSPISTTESCASISDANGNLLFYTNGVNVWDASHTVMPNGNGLMGNESSQCMIIPKPGSTSIYYVFTTDAPQGAIMDGLRYSEVDMTLNGGMGDVSILKNVSLNLQNGEWITAVADNNCNDIWVLTHGYGSNSSFLAYRVSSAGVNPTPVSTNLGLSITGGIDIIGVMKPKTIGDTIAMTLPHYDKSIRFIEFNRSTGVATSINTIYTAPGSERAYGIEFSRSGKVFYACDFLGDLYQYDADAVNVAATRTFIGGLTVSGELGQLQLAPNDKIYFGTNIFAGAASSIGVINNPETLGAGCNMVINGVSLGAATQIYGLPWHYNKDLIFGQSPGLILGNDTMLCEGSQIELSVGVGSVNNYLWSDGSTDSTLMVDSLGIYWVEVQAGGCDPVRDSIVVNYDTTAINQQVVNADGCSPVSANFTGSSVGGAIAEWFWDLGDGSLDTGQTVSHVYTNPGNYNISLKAQTIHNCLVTAPQLSTVEVFQGPTAMFDYTPGSGIKPGDDVWFEDMSVGNIANWFWYLGDGNKSDSAQFTYNYQFEDSYLVTLIVTDSMGCTDTATSIVVVEGNSIFVPNAFTPNGDGKNDVFFAVVPNSNTRIQLQVFDRWGALIWEGGNGDQWSGNFNGHPAKSDVYVWKATITNDATTEVKELVGHIILLR